MSLTPHVEEVRLDIGAVLDRLNYRFGFSIFGLMLHCGGKLARVLLRETFKEDHCQIRSLGLRRRWIVLDELLNFLGVSLTPILYVLAVGGIRIDPSLLCSVVSIRPLRDDMWLSSEAILLEPRLDVRRHQLSRLSSALVLDDRAQSLGYAIAQHVVIG